MELLAWKMRLPQAYTMTQTWGAEFWILLLLPVPSTPGSDYRFEDKKI